MENNADIRYYSMDFLKIMATIFIVFHHYQQITGVFFEGAINWYGGKFYWGYMVELFFILSGFFMFRYIPIIQKGCRFKDFYLKRMFRLLPLMTVSILGYEIISIVYLLFCGSSMGTITVWGTIVSSLGLQAGWVFSNPGVNNPTWYISVLLLCYIIFYLVTRISIFFKITPVYFYIFMILIGCGISTYGINLPFFNSFSSRGYYAFFTGILLAKLLNKWKPGAKTYFACVVLIVGIITIIVTNNSYIEYGLCYTLTFFFYPAVIIVFHSDFIKHIFQHRIWGLWGKISYNVFVWHTPMVIAVYFLIEKIGFSIDFSKISTMFIFGVVTQLIGVLSHFVIEKPLNQVTNKLLLQLTEKNELSGGGFGK